MRKPLKKYKATKTHLFSCPANIAARLMETNDSVFYTEDIEVKGKYIKEVPISGREKGLIESGKISDNIIYRDSLNALTR